jgi:hypothetical protein
MVGEKPHHYRLPYGWQHNLMLFGYRHTEKVSSEDDQSSALLRGLKGSGGNYFMWRMGKLTSSCKCREYCRSHTSPGHPTQHLLSWHGDTMDQRHWQAYACLSKQQFCGSCKTQTNAHLWDNFRVSVMAEALSRFAKPYSLHPTVALHNWTTDEVFALASQVQSLLLDEGKDRHLSVQLAQEVPSCQVCGNK